MAPIVLSIGTTHPWNVAGVGRDLVVGSTKKCRIFTAVAAVSAQNASGVVALGAVAPELFEAQLSVLPWESAGAVRVGALPTPASVRAVAEALAAHPWLPAVVDPVFAASSGGELADRGAREALEAELATLSSVILTPNLREAAALLQLATIERSTLADAAARLRARGTGAVLLTGGHLDGDPADALATTSGVEILSEPRIAGAMHGTGCTLAMALACELAWGTPLREAVRSARAFVREEIARH
ncbi:MAG: hydroxymethylpyrimidine/phosphomethylpyrimidine kinase [Candidatus Cybelea sp.]|jgi:hydroxymethylpyrimidine/phosphomethylpyrimidine kinase